MFLAIVCAFIFFIFIWILKRIRRPKVHYNPEGKVAGIVSQMKSIIHPYFPTPWLISSDIQTVWGMRYRPSSTMKCEREEFDFPDGGCTVLDWFKPKEYEEGAPVVIVVHTMGGGTREPCTNNICESCTKKGWLAVVANQRGCSGARMKTARMYDGLHIDDLQNIIKHVKEVYHPKDIFMVGFSMGAYLTAEYSLVDGSITACCCVSHTYNAVVASDILEKNKKNRKLYMPIIVAKLKHQIEKNQFIDADVKAAVKKAVTLSDFGEAFTAKHAGVENNLEYCQRVSVAQKIPGMKCPVMFIGSDDDPFTAKRLMPLKEVVKSENVVFVETKEGGHVSFCEGLDGKRSYAEDVAIEWFEIAAKNK